MAAEPERQLEEHDWPRAHLLMDDFFPPRALDAIFREVRSLDRRMKPGLVRDVGHDGQSVFFEHRRRRNRAIWIHDPSTTLRLFRERLWSDAMVASFELAREPLFQIIPNCSAPHLQVSSYMTGDHYDFHEDEGAGVNLTAIVFLASNPEKVRGGDLVLAYEGEETTIPFRHNRLVIFPAKTMHRVTRVRVDSTDRRHARISLQCWLTYGPQESKPKRRAPEADRPTFLLAEEPILAAAQAMSRAARADQTPEDLYWGAFYLSRILAQNLRCLVAEHDAVTLGRITVRHRDGGELEVQARGRKGPERAPIRVGFLLRPPQTPPSKALSLFVESKQSGRVHRSIPLGAGERETRRLLERLLARA